MKSCEALDRAHAAPGKAPSARDDRIHRRIVDAIVQHRLTPGARLPEDALSEVFGVSRTSIRKVLHRLELERLVTSRPHRGAAVARPSQDEARDVFAARRLIEGGSLPSVMERYGPTDRRALRELVEAEHDARAVGRHSEAIHVSAAFHVRLIEVSGNGALTDFVKQLTSRSSLVIAVYGSPHSVGCDCGEHGELLDLIDQSDGARAQEWMERHLDRIESSLSFRVPDEGTPDFQAIFGGGDEAKAG